MPIPAAILFDMDDTLVRSAPIWKQAETEVLRLMNADWSPELAASYKGMNALDVARVMFESLKPAGRLEHYQQRLRALLIEGFSSGVTEMPGAAALVASIAGRTPLAVASGSPLKAIRLALGQLQIEHLFQAIVTSESVPRGKPHPDVFLRAALALGVEPSRCLVIEDSFIGCRAARAADMACWVVPSMPFDRSAIDHVSIYSSLTELGNDLLMQ